jgi:hypothetical protein
MEQAIGNILIITGGVVTLVALFTVLSLLISGTTDRIRTVMLEHPVRSFLVGLVNFLFSAAIAALLAQLVGKVKGLESVFAILAVLILGWLSVPALVGLASIVGLLRERMGTGGQNTVRGTMWASLLLVLAALVPFVGWFVFTPVALLTGLGAAVFTLFRHERPQRIIQPTKQVEEKL